MLIVAFTGSPRVLLVARGGCRLNAALPVALSRGVCRGRFPPLLLCAMLGRPVALWAVDARPGDQGDAPAAAVRHSSFTPPSSS